MTKQQHTVEALTAAEIQAQVRTFSELDDQITGRLAAIFAARSAGTAEPIISDYEKAARQRAVAAERARERAPADAEGCGV